MSAAVAVVKGLQSVNVGRVKVERSLVLLDDHVASVFRSDPALLSNVLYRGALGAIALSEVSRLHGEGWFRELGEKDQCNECTLLVSCRTDAVDAAVDLLEQEGFRVSLYCCAPQTVEPESKSKLLPVFIQTVDILPIPLFLFRGADDLPFCSSAKSLEYSQLAIQVSSFLEFFCQAGYDVFAMGARPNALASAMKAVSGRVKEKAKQEMWQEEALFKRAQLLILDRESDLLAASSPLLQRSALSHILWHRHGVRDTKSVDDLLSMNDAQSKQILRSFSQTEIPDCLDFLVGRLEEILR